MPAWTYGAETWERTEFELGGHTFSGGIAWNTIRLNTKQNSDWLVWVALSRDSRGLETADGRLSPCIQTSSESKSCYQMKVTEVPNPRCNSACDCTCVLTRNRSLSRDSLMLTMRIVLFLPMQSSLTSFWHSFTGLVQLIFSFPSWFHTIWFYCSHTFHS